MGTTESTTPRTTRSPYRAFVIAIAALAVAVVGIGVALAAHQGDFAPSRSVSVTNDTGGLVNWSCSSANLHLSPGDSGRLRLPDRSDADFVCVTGTGAHEVDTCPDLAALASRKTITVSSWVRQFTCP